MFIRVKKIKKRSGKIYEYAQLVHGIWKKRRWNLDINKRRNFRKFNNSVHKYKKFLGRVYKFNIEDTDFSISDNFTEFVEKNPVNIIYRKLIEHELKVRGFKIKRGVLVHKNIFVDLDRLIIHDGKSDVVIKLQDNGGYLCSLTLNELFEIKSISNRYEGIYLMKKLRMAGLRLKHEQFFVLADKLLKENDFGIHN